MSKKGNVRKAAYQKKQEMQAKKVIYWIFGVLLIFAVCLLGILMTH